MKAVSACLAKCGAVTGPWKNIKENISIDSVSETVSKIKSI